MESPFRSEAAAFRFLLITVGAFALIVLASWVHPLLGIATTVLLSAAAVVAYLRLRGPRPPQEHVEHVGPVDVRRVLVAANETVGGDELLKAIGELALAGKTEFYVVAPALNSRLRTWTSDEDAARAAAEKRLQASLERLRSVGVDAHGTVGDLDPLVSIEDGVRTFHPDEIVVSTHPEGKSNWLERGVVEAVRQRYDVPVRHVVVDLEKAESPHDSA